MRTPTRPHVRCSLLERRHCSWWRWKSWALILSSETTTLLLKAGTVATRPPEQAPPPLLPQSAMEQTEGKESKTETTQQ
jgi:hypothetical protein